jgi:hypothetical protein
MRNVLLFITLVGTLLAVDTFAFDGRYRRAFWLEAAYQGQKFRYDVDDLLRNLNF